MPNFGRVALWLFGGLLCLGGFVIFVAFLLIPFANFIARSDLEPLQGKDRIDALNNVRQLVLASIGALFATAGALVAVRTYSSNRRGQLTDRFAKAIEHLASAKVDERLGGIYSLQHVMRESIQEHQVVIEVLAAFIREHSWSYQRKADPDYTTYPEEEDPNDIFEEFIPTLGTDIQAALAVIGSRPDRSEEFSIDLSNFSFRSLISIKEDSKESRSTTAC